MAPPARRQRGVEGGLLVGKVEKEHHSVVVGPLADHQDVVRVEGRCFDVLLGHEGDGRHPFAQGEQVAVERAQVPMIALVGQGMVEFAAAKGVRVLWIGHVASPVERGKFFPPPLAHRLDQGRVGVANEILERCRLAVLLAHEEQRNEWREQHGSGGEPLPRRGQCRTETVAQAPIADLVVVLGEDHKLLREIEPRTAPVPALPVARVLAGVRVALPPHFCELGQAAVVAVIALLFPRQKDVQRVMKIVAPLRIEPVASQPAGKDVAGHVEIAFGDEMKVAPVGRGRGPARLA